RAGSRSAHPAARRRGGRVRGVTTASVHPERMPQPQSDRGDAATPPPPELDPASRAWIAALRPTAPGHDEAVGRLRALLLRAARTDDPALAAERAELLHAVQSAIRQQLTPHQRRVLLALAVQGVPIDVLAERLSTTRGALYKTLHDARRKLRRELAAAGYDLD